MMKLWDIFHHRSELGSSIEKIKKCFVCMWNKGNNKHLFFSDTYYLHRPCRLLFISSLFAKHNNNKMPFVNASVMLHKNCTAHRENFEIESVHIKQAFSVLPYEPSTSLRKSERERKIKCAVKHKLHESCWRVWKFKPHFYSSSIIMNLISFKLSQEKTCKKCNRELKCNEHIMTTHWPSPFIKMLQYIFNFWLQSE